MSSSKEVFFNVVKDIEQSQTNQPMFHGTNTKQA